MNTFLYVALLIGTPLAACFFIAYGLERVDKAVAAYVKRRHQRAESAEWVTWVEEGWR